VKKKFIVTLASILALGTAGITFAAENPFSDVPAGDWAYGAVSQLNKAGIVEGSNIGEKTMTRYEMAKVVEKAMSKADKADAEKKALIYRLSVEFSPELFGINAAKPQVAKSETVQPAVKFSGIFDTRFNAINYHMKDYSGNNGYAGNATAGSIKSTADNPSYRFRLQAEAKVGDKSTVTIRLVNMSPYQNITPGTRMPWQNSWANYGTAPSGTAPSATGDGNTGNTIMADRAFITSKIGDVTAQVGRMPLVVGSTGAIAESAVMSVDGLRLSIPVDGFTISATHGNVYKASRASVIEVSKQEGKAKLGAGYFQLRNYDYTKTTWSQYALGADLKTVTPIQVPMQLVYGNAYYKFDPNFSLTTEISKNIAGYAKNPAVMSKQNTMFIMTALYGDQVFTKTGQSNFKVQYYSVGRDALGQDNSKDFYGKCFATFDLTTTDKYYTGFTLAYNYAFDKNMILTLQRTGITDHGSKDNSYHLLRAMIATKF